MHQQVGGEKKNEISQTINCLIVPLGETVCFAETTSCTGWREPLSHLGDAWHVVNWRFYTKTVPAIFWSKIRRVFSAFWHFSKKDRVWREFGVESHIVLSWCLQKVIIMLDFRFQSINRGSVWTIHRMDNMCTVSTLERQCAVELSTKAVASSRIRWAPDLVHSLGVSALRLGLFCSLHLL